MEAWKLVLDEAAFQFLVASQAGDRRKLLSAFEQLRNKPHREPDYWSKDSTDRELSVWAVRPFLITYWLDSLTSEIRIANIQKIRF